MALSLNTTVLTGQTVVTDTSTGSVAIDFSTVFGRIATALETIATNSTAIKTSLETIATKQTSIATDTSTIAIKQTTIADKQTSIATDTSTIALNTYTTGGLFQGVTTFTTSGTSVSTIETYSNISQISSSGAGTGALFTIQKRNDETSYNGIVVTIVSPGLNYEVGDTIVLPGDKLGGSTPTNNLTLTVGSNVLDSSIVNSLNLIIGQLSLMSTTASNITDKQTSIATSQDSIAANINIMSDIRNSISTIASKQTTISTNIGTLTALGSTGAGIKMVSPFDWTFGTSTVYDPSKNLDHTLATLQEIANKLPRYL